MDLELDDEQAALVDSVRTVLAREWPPSAVRRLVEDGAGADALWDRMVDLDWPALCVPEEHGGMGYGPIESALVMERCGAAAVTGPLLATIGLFTPLVRELASAEHKDALLGDVASGAATGTAAISELARRGSGIEIDAAALTVTAKVSGDGWILHGTARSVLDAGHVDRIVVPASLAGGDDVGVFVVSSGAAGVALDPVRSVDATCRLATVQLDGATVDRAGVLGEPGSPGTRPALRRALDEAVTVVAADLVGTCSTILAWTLEHAKEREQFGVKIGSFQAVKHRLADAYLALEAARAAVLFASTAIAEDDPRRLVAASTAKALASDAAALLTREGIQLLGGIGFTWEHDMQLFVKRAMATSALFGTAEAHRQRVADLIGLVPVCPAAV